MDELKTWQAMLARKGQLQRLFSIFNATFDADQMKSFGDYIE